MCKRKKTIISKTYQCFLRWRLSLFHCFYSCGCWQNGKKQSSRKGVLSFSYSSLTSHKNNIYSIHTCIYKTILFAPSISAETCFRVRKFSFKIKVFFNIVKKKITNKKIFYYNKSYSTSFIICLIQIMQNTV